MIDQLPRVMTEEEAKYWDRMGSRRKKLGRRGVCIEFHRDLILQELEPTKTQLREKRVELKEAKKSTKIRNEAEDLMGEDLGPANPLQVEVDQLAGIMAEKTVNVETQLDALKDFPQIRSAKQINKRDREELASLESKKQQRHRAQVKASKESNELLARIRAEKLRGDKREVQVEEARLERKINLQAKEEIQ